MDLTDVIHLRTGGEVAYSSETTTVEGILAGDQLLRLAVAHVAAEGDR